MAFSDVKKPVKFTSLHTHTGTKDVSIPYLPNLPLQQKTVDRKKFLYLALLGTTKESVHNQNKKVEIVR